MTRLVASVSVSNSLLNRSMLALMIRYTGKLLLDRPGYPITEDTITRRETLLRDGGNFKRQRR